ncbi:MAG: PAS domain-containing protein [Chloroflexota bacterium]
MEEADVDLFARRVASMRERVSQLFRDAQSGATSDLLTLAFDELQGALDELQFAEAALRAQSQQQLISEEALETERRYYCDLFERAPVGYLVTSSDGTIRQANRPASELLGVPARQLIGRSLALFVPEGSRRKFRARISQLGCKDTPDEWILQLQPWEGQPFDALLLAAPARDTGGRVASLRWLIHRPSAALLSHAAGEHSDTVELERRNAQLAAELEDLRAQIRALAHRADEAALQAREVGGPV